MIGEFISRNRLGEMRTSKVHWRTATHESGRHIARFVAYTWDSWQIENRSNGVVEAFVTINTTRERKQIKYGDPKTRLVRRTELIQCFVRLGSEYISIETDVVWDLGEVDSLGGMVLMADSGWFHMLLKQYLETKCIETGANVEDIMNAEDRDIEQHCQNLLDLLSEVEVFQYFTTDLDMHPVMVDRRKRKEEKRRKKLAAKGG